MGIDSFCPHFLKFFKYLGFFYDVGWSEGTPSLRMGIVKLVQRMLWEKSGGPELWGSSHDT